MNSGAGDTTQLVPGFPIRTPWDHSSVDSSPRPIAASHVLHRLLVPRHPPSALDNLTTHKTNHRKQDARVHCAILNQRPTHNPTENTDTAGTEATGMFPRLRLAPKKPTTPERLPSGARPHPGGRPTDPHSKGGRPRLFLQDPTGCLYATTSRPRRPFPRDPRPRVLGQPAVAGDDSPVSPPTSTPPPPAGGAGSFPPLGGRFSLERR